ncbi:hypothetical protein HHK36_011537 [Tetracentron sinense]|uniref:PGG domain-containing protein n=1 Tax=Tetracentron sinense TaxID=13715 RepID=A0A834ZDV6_TETSI|nr:hypothetical protein HHK36_011537 [Tetracentron sinense]
MNKNRTLPQTRDKVEWTPLLCAATVARLEQKEMVQHLYLETKDEDPSPFAGASGAELLCNITASDVPVEMELTDAPCHAVRGETEKPPESSRVPVRFQPGTYLSEVFQKLNILLWKVLETLAPGVKKVRETKLSHIHAFELVKHVSAQIQTSEFFRKSNIFTTAIEFGIIELLVEYLESFPRLNVSEGELVNEPSMFHIAVKHRQEKIFNLIYGRTASKMIVGRIKDESDIIILHVAAKLAPSPQLNSISGAALQMQRELQWFKLLLYGGNRSEKGIPIFLKTSSFMIFAISDALSLFSSLTSVLMFLSILTSHYAEEDFLYMLPKRLIIGLKSLFISIATMMIAFTVTLSIVLRLQLESLENQSKSKVLLLLCGSQPEALETQVKSRASIKVNGSEGVENRGSLGTLKPIGSNVENWVELVFTGMFVSGGKKKYNS